MRTFELRPGRQWLIRLETDGELYGQITEAAVTLGFQTATFTVLGAVGRAALRIYDQQSKAYQDLDLEEEMELLAGVGNISARDGVPFVHCHATFGLPSGRAVGGHLHETRPTVVFVAEVWIQELLGEPPTRLFDERCGLALWG